jgi:hypothetical protein
MFLPVQNALQKQTSFFSDVLFISKCDMEMDNPDALQKDIGPLKLSKEAFLHTRLVDIVVRSVAFQKNPDISRLLLVTASESHQDTYSMKTGIFNPPWEGNFVFKTHNIPQEERLHVFVKSSKTLTRFLLTASGTTKKLLKGDTVWFGPYSRKKINTNCIPNKRFGNFCMVEIFGLKSDF